MRLSEVTAVLTAARFLWRKDRDIAYKSDADEDGLCRAWHRHLAPFSVDEVTAAMDALLRANASDWCPSLGMLVSEVRAARHRQQPASTPLAPRSEPAVPPSLNPYRAKLRADLRQAARRPDGTIDPDALAQIDERVDEVGEHEQRALAFIDAHPDADYGRVCKEFVDAWIAAMVKQRGVGRLAAVPEAVYADEAVTSRREPVVPSTDHPTPHEAIAMKETG